MLLKKIWLSEFEFPSSVGFSSSLGSPLSSSGSQDGTLVISNEDVSPDSLCAF
jgi:hypothetical protein